jgi:5-formyltetrahydrofolate cyclo-ligase
MAEPLDKAAARKLARVRRALAHDPSGSVARVACAHLSAALVARFGARLAELTLAGFAPIGDEIDPTPALAAHPGPTCLPVVTGRAQPLEFHAWRVGDALVQADFGVCVPAVARMVIPDILIVPLLAFDAQGYRLGYGGGFYDRTLADLGAARPVFALGLAYAAQQVEAMPREGTDMALDGIVTEQGVIWPSAGR